MSEEKVGIVYNACDGGFGLSVRAWSLYHTLSGNPTTDADHLERSDPILVQIVEKLGKRANSESANLKIEYLPKGTKYFIDMDEHGNEAVETLDSFEWKTA